MRMNHWTEAELAFRCERLSARLARLAQNFRRMAVLSLEGADGEAALAIVRESKGFLELTAIDLTVEPAYELAQMQRQLSRWHMHWLEVWAKDATRLEISTVAQAWAGRVGELARVLV
jgi:hypothetical protein